MEREVGKDEVRKRVRAAQRGSKGRVWGRGRRLWRGRRAPTPQEQQVGGAVDHPRVSVHH